jgi:hypothetical protein
MELEGDRHEARRIATGVKSRGQLLPKRARGLHRMDTVLSSR